VINGGIGSLADAEHHLSHVDGVMLGRAAYQTPYILAEVDRRFFSSDSPVLSRAEALARLRPVVARHLERGGRLNNIVRHILGLYHGEPGARLFRRYLSENAVRSGAGLDVYDDAIAIVERERGRARSVTA
jgi:tRNA-dihydrouridine synthase A